MDAFKQFYQAHKDRLFAYLVRLTGDYDRAGDMLQESFTRYLEHYRSAPQSLRLLYTIARHVFLDDTRKRRRVADYPEAERISAADDGESDPESRVMIRQEYRQVLAAMETLRKADRDILALVLGGDLTYAEIAEMVGTTEANVKVRVHRSRVRLREMLVRGEA